MPVVAKVRLLAYTQDPYGITVASARTCYAKDFVFVGELGPKGKRERQSLAQIAPNHADRLDRLAIASRPIAERQGEFISILAELPRAADAITAFWETIQSREQADERIASSILEAGHHTPFQHPTFVFSFDNVSRNVVETFFHQHIFFNSEQQSQRYVEMRQAEVFVPASIAASKDAMAVFEGAVSHAWDAYHHLRQNLIQANVKTMSAIGKIKGQTEAQIQGEAEKKSQEMARYVIPVAAATRMYHTVSGVVLLRYARMRNATGVSEEVSLILDEMVKEISKVDGRFASFLDAPIQVDDHLDRTIAKGIQAPVENLSVELLAITPNAEKIVEGAIDDLFGGNAAENLRNILDPAKNPLWNDTLNTWDHSPSLRALRHVHLTYKKSISLTAYAQDQRHRMVPATRAPLERHVLGPNGHHEPEVIAKSPEDSKVFWSAIHGLEEAIAKLRDLGIPSSDLTYLLPNSTLIQFTQTGDLLSLIHKWRLRLCFNAQKEIFDASVAELRLAQAEIPKLTWMIGPPCTFVAQAVPESGQDDPALCCPEGSRWCGVKVWKNFDAAKGKPRRPF